jgi:peptide/nickel transport system ATP-binding protein
MSAVAETPAHPATQTEVLRVSGLRAYYLMSYFGVSREVRAVDDVSLSVKRNEIYGIAGESSSGKTTLIKVIAGAIQPPLTIVGGSVTFNFSGREVDVHRAGAPLKAIRWKHLSYIMQGSMNVLNPVRRVRHAFRDFAFRHMGLPADAFWERVSSHLKRLDLDPGILGVYPHQLSGGMRQRVTIALATVCEPEFIIADEPTTALDVLVQQDVLTLIKDVQRRLGSSVIFVTHDMSVHAAIADRIGIFYAGRLVEEGETSAVFAAPQHPYTAHLIASLPRLGDVRRRKSLPGRPPNLADPPAGCRFHPRCPLAIDRCKTEVPPLELRGRGRVACWRAGEVGES